MPPGHGSTFGPANDPVGVTGSGNLRINNDYVYPRYTLPPHMRAQGFRSEAEPLWGELFPRATSGLMRGWIYPMDAYGADALAVTGASSVGDIDDALARVRQERDEADAAAGVTPSTVGTTNPAVGPPTSVLAQNGDSARLIKKIRYREGKQFQFNPFAVEINVGMNTAAPPETQQQGGTAGTEQVGGATTSLELFFDRTIETNAATHGMGTINGHTIDPIFKDIGVQKDLWDIYRMILGGDPDYFSKIGQTLVNIDSVSGMTLRPGSVTDLTTRLFDLGMAGGSAFGRRIAIFYNSNLVIIGDVTGIGFVYAEFNANFVPIKAKIDLDVSILHSTSESGADTFAGATPTTAAGLPGSDGNAGISGATIQTATAPTGVGSSNGSVGMAGAPV